jgi:hypothetical protein
MSTAQRHFVNMVRIMLITMLLSTASGHSHQSKYRTSCVLQNRTTKSPLHI